MINLVKVISSAFDSVKRRIVKGYAMGTSDVRTAFEASPYGIDSNPIANMRAIYAETAVKGQPVIIGYVNKNQLADVGENRIYATDKDGNLKFYIWQKADGTVEIGGTADNAVRYTPLNTGLQDFITLLQAELVKIAAGITGVGGSYAPGTMSIDISASKIDEIKTP